VRAERLLLRRGWGELKFGANLRITGRLTREVGFISWGFDCFRLWKGKLSDGLANNFRAYRDAPHEKSAEELRWPADATVIDHQRRRPWFPLVDASPSVARLVDSPFGIGF